jgi:Autophagy-related protein 27
MYSVPDSQYTLDFNVCGKVIETTPTKCTQESGDICQYQGGQFVSMIASTAQANTWASVTVNGKATYQTHSADGDNCVGVTDKPRTSTIIFSCDPDHQVGTLTTSKGANDCDYVINFPTSIACGGGGGSPSKSKGLSGGWVFIIILLCVTPVYIAGGCYWNHRKNPEATWREKCPHAGFWAAIPGLTKDGCVFTYQKLRACMSGDNSEGGYSNM